MNRIYNPVLNSTLGNFASNNAGSRISGIIRGLIQVGFIIGSVIFIFMILTGGVQYITSGGDKEATGKAQKRITTGLIGLLILFSLYAIIGLVSTFFGFNLLLITLPSINI